MNAERKALWAEAFGDDEAFIDGFFATAFSEERHMTLTEQGQLLAAAYWLDCQYAGGKLAYIYAVATKKEARGRGLCHALMEEIHKKLKRDGYSGAVLVPGAPSLARLYEALGYGFFGGMETFSAAAGEEREALQTLSAAQYSRLRRQWLPEGIWQEGASLEFLEAQGVRFAAGEDLLLAYTREKEAIFGLELLGDRKKAPGILAALGAAQGRFRVPGEKPFAMFKALADVPAPTHLGFAFD